MPKIEPNYPTPEEVNATYMSYTQAAEELGIEIDTNIAHSIRKAGLQTVRLATKPMVYRHQVEALKRKMERNSANIER